MTRKNVIPSDVIMVRKFCVHCPPDVIALIGIGPSNWWKCSSCKSGGSQIVRIKPGDNEYEKFARQLQVASTSIKN